MTQPPGAEGGAPARTPRRGVTADRSARCWPGEQRGPGPAARGAGSGLRAGGPRSRRARGYAILPPVHPGRPWWPAGVLPEPPWTCGACHRSCSTTSPTSGGRRRRSWPRRSGTPARARWWARSWRRWTASSSSSTTAGRSSPTTAGARRVSPPRWPASGPGRPSPARTRRARLGAAPSPPAGPAVSWEPSWGASRRARRWWRSAPSPPARPPPRSGSSASASARSRWRATPSPPCCCGT